MKTSKSLISIVVAASLVGAIGLAYAQTQTPSQPVDPSSAMTNQPATGGMSAPMANQPATGTMPAPSTDTSMQAERPVQADRN